MKKKLLSVALLLSAIAAASTVPAMAGAQFCTDTLPKPSRVLIVIPNPLDELETNARNSAPPPFVLVDMKRKLEMYPKQFKIYPNGQVDGQNRPIYEGPGEIVTGCEQVEAWAPVNFIRNISDGKQTEESSAMVTQLGGELFRINIPSF